MLKKIALILLMIAPMTVFAQKFGHIKSQEILFSMPEYTKAQTDIETLKKQHQEDIKRITDELQKKYAEYQQEQANLPKNILERRQKELQDLNERAMQAEQDARMDLENSWMAMIQPIAKKVDDAIKAVGQEGGYVYIFDLDTTNIPFVNENSSTDVTNAVKAKLGIK